MKHGSKEHIKALADGRKRHHQSRGWPVKKTRPDPSALLMCHGCREEQPRSVFVGGGRRENAQRRFCTTCRQKKDAGGRELFWAVAALSRARVRSVRDNKEFTIAIHDILAVMPPDGECPIFHQPLVFGTKNQDWNPSLDRIDNSKGYTPDNIVVVSNLANRSKGHLSHQQLHQMASFYTRNPTRISDKWDRRFLELAREVSTWSRDPSTKVGAVLVRSDRTIAALGYNGFPQGMPDKEEHYKDRAQKLSRVCHAEMNALMWCRDPLPLDGVTLYATGPCCDRCAVHMIQAGIRRFVFMKPTDEQWIRWNVARTMEYFREVKAQVVVLDLEAAGE